MTESAPGLTVVMTTVPAEDVAVRLARGLVESRLAACVQVVPGARSFYVWEGKAQDEGEWLLFVKTVPKKRAELEAWIEEHHPYDLPEFVALEGRGSQRYAAWVAERVLGT